MMSKHGARADSIDAKLDAISARADALQPNPWANKLAALNGGIDSLTARLARNDAKDEPDAIKEAAKKAGMSVEDYLAQRKKANKFHLREMQRREMSI